MKSDLFQHEVRKTSSVFGRKEDVTVEFQGEDAMTNGSNIILPAMDFEKDISKNDQAIMRGYVDHESGHIRHTDFKALNKFGKENEGNKLLLNLQNAIEDIYLEKRVIDEYAGSKDNLVATSGCVNDGFLESIGTGFEKEALDNLTFITPVASTWEGRKHYGNNGADICLDLLKPHVREKIERWTKKIDDCKNTKDVIALAKKIEKEIREEEPKKEAPKPTDVSVGKTPGKKGNEPGDADENRGPSIHKERRPRSGVDNHDGGHAHAGEPDEPAVVCVRRRLDEKR